MNLFQKRGFKRGLLALTGVALIAIGISAFGHSRSHFDIDSEQTQARIVAKVGAKLELDAAQKQQLDALLKVVAEQHQALMGGKAGKGAAQQDPRQVFGALLAGPKFDRTAAQTLVETKTALLREKSPQLIEALGNFYDSLRPDQQQELRGHLESKRGRHRGDHGDRGDHGHHG